MVRTSTRLSRESSGTMRSLLLATFDGPVVYRAQQIHSALSGIGTDEDLIIRMLSACSNDDINAVKAKYQELYNKDLIERIEKNTSGDISRLLVSLLQGTRADDGEVDNAQVEADAKALYAAGQGKTIGHDAQPFISIITQRSPSHLIALNGAYCATHST
eukprot:GABW01000752.1.p1 GENE.GABW01000752.1~~GABW01000752.1.p1  ORF type:complete len:160 (-),score=86.18 GABW01000752.1:3-482(-)